MNLSTDLLAALAYNSILIGSAWGHLASVQSRTVKDVISIKKSLGLENGHSGAFVRQDQYDFALDSQKENIARLEREIAEIRSQAARGQA